MVLRNSLDPQVPVGLVGESLEFSAFMVPQQPASFTFRFGDGTSESMPKQSDGEATVTHNFTESGIYIVEVEAGVGGSSLSTSIRLEVIDPENMHDPSCPFQDAGNIVASDTVAPRAIVHVFMNGQPLLFDQNKTLYLQVGDRITVSGRCSVGSILGNRPVDEYQWKTLEQPEGHNGFDRNAGMDLMEKEVLIDRPGLHIFKLRVNVVTAPVESAEVQFRVSVPEPTLPPGSG